ncbi:phosphoenolpyruvate synthase [uncultured Chitinophaga sp.]|uniref:phosphoenolpyruvate synthase n=1 Tax=uncultured Chitinophaga sp. TaxID=339340 RepID=UPI0025D2A3F7|nr:phosphoenolpyruvate synthase [uncultured Chitinophaga sp.]
MKEYIRLFRNIRIGDVPSVGGKNASLGEMVSGLSNLGITVPDGYAVTAEAFREFIQYNALEEALRRLMQSLDKTDYGNLNQVGARARELMLDAIMPGSIEDAIIKAYRELAGGLPLRVAVRSSATAEDLPQASFAGQHDSFLNIAGELELVKAVQHCFASLYTNRAIKYREDQGFEHDKIAISVGVQKMVHADTGCSGICFTLEPETGFRDIIHISGGWGLGENIVQGNITPDEFYLFKPALLQGKKAIVQKKLGAKEKTMCYAEDGTKRPVINIQTPEEKRSVFVLSDGEVTQLANWARIIEQHYQLPMDIEWAKDGDTNELFILQARPETVHARKQDPVFSVYSILEKGECLAEGEAVGEKIVCGVARLLSSPDDAGRLQPGEIIVTDLTSPDWDPLLKKSAGIVTNKGGRTSHASIVARELGVPAVVGTGDATAAIKDGELITVSCCEGKMGHVYRGKAEIVERKADIRNIRMPEGTEVMLIAADPGQAFQLSFYPNDGVGLMRMEFIITHMLGIHPMALVKYDELTDAAVKAKIDTLTRHYDHKEQYFVDRLSQGIATMAAAFYPKDVIVRFSDFKTNEYASLTGGQYFEPREENPMLGFRGASRYYNERYKPAFGLECAAIKVVREEMGLSNVKVMVPFCRTVEEGRKVLDTMKEFGLDREKDTSLQVYVMVEIPSNVLQAEAFAAIFDGFSIGSNDLTQLTLGIDRDSEIVSGLFNEQHAAAKQMVSMAIQKARATGTPVGLCGQAPSDFPEYARFLVEAGINSIAFTADAIFKGIENVIAAEQKMEVVF